MTRWAVLIVAMLGLGSLVLPARFAAQSGGARERWVATWGTALQLARYNMPPRMVTPPPPPPPGAPARRFAAPVEIPRIADQTVRMIVRTSIGGQRLRVRLANAFGAGAVTIGAAHIARRQAGSSIVPGSDRTLTFGGQPTTILYAGQTIISDPVELDAPPLTDLAISLYIVGTAEPPTAHRFGLRPTYVSTPGDFTAAPSIDSLAQTTESYYWLAGVDVLAPAKAGTLVTFGDSITDGDQSTPDTNRMWPAVLAERLQRNPATRHVGVVNAGISGNRLLGDNNGGVVRFMAHALAVPGVRWITVLEGINDITIATRRPGVARGIPAGGAFSAESLIGAYKQLIAMAHVHGVQVIGCTLTPYGGSSAFSEAGEAIRQEVNDWIRTSGAFDAVIDFDAVTRDPDVPQRFRPEAESPDLLHPGDGGYRLMAEAVDITLFASPSRTAMRVRGPERVLLPMGPAD